MSVTQIENPADLYDPNSPAIYKAVGAGTGLLRGAEITLDIRVSDISGLLAGMRVRDLLADLSEFLPSISGPVDDTAVYVMFGRIRAFMTIVQGAITRILDDTNAAMSCYTRDALIELRNRAGEFLAETDI